MRVNLINSWMLEFDVESNVIKWFYFWQMVVVVNEDYGYFSFFVEFGQCINIVMIISRYIIYFVYDQNDFFFGCICSFVIVSKVV